jgi:hypothetical protein
LIERCLAKHWDSTHQPKAKTCNGLIATVTWIC